MALVTPVEMQYSGVCPSPASATTCFNASANFFLMARYVDLDGAGYKYNPRRCMRYKSPPRVYFARLQIIHVANIITPWKHSFSGKLSISSRSSLFLSMRAIEPFGRGGGNNRRRRWWKWREKNDRICENFLKLPSVLLLSGTRGSDERFMIIPRSMRGLSASVPTRGITFATLRWI